MSQAFKPELDKLFITLQEGFSKIPAKGKIEQEAAVAAIGQISLALCEALLLYDENSLQQQCIDTQYFLYFASFLQEYGHAEVTFKNNENPNSEIEYHVVRHEQGNHRVILSERKVIPGKYVEGIAGWDIEPEDLPEGIETDGEVKVTQEGQAIFLQRYPELVRKGLSCIVLESTPKYLWQNSRENAFRGPKGMFYLFWNREIVNRVFIPAWNPQYARRYFSELKKLVSKIQPMIFSAAKK